MTERHAVRQALKSFGVSLLVSAALVAPFVVLELVNRRAFGEAFPFVLFTLMSLHALSIVLVLRPAVGRLRAAQRLRALGPGHWVGLLLGVLLIVAYANVILDQLPCFLGVPNCD
jgi:hypothetical protein